MLSKMRILMGPENERGSGSGKKQVTMDEDELEEMVGKMVNGAVTGLTKKGHFKTAIAEAVTGIVGPQFDELKTLLTKTPDPGAGDKGSAGDQGKGGNELKLPAEVQRQLDEQARTIKRLTDQAATSDAVATAAKKRNDDAEEHSALLGALKKAGVAEDRIDGAAALLRHERKRVMRDKEGKIKYALAKEGYIDEVDLESGVAEWAKSAEGKGYLPPKEVQGAGARGGLAPIVRGQEPSEAQLFDALGNALMGRRVDLG